MKNRTPLLVFIGALPILFPVFNPSAELGAIGIVIGFWGTFLSPIIIFGFLIYQILKKD